MPDMPTVPGPEPWDGMSLVAGIADRWGHFPLGTGRVVWFELALPDVTPP
jgi:hypothetical protein